MLRAILMTAAALMAAPAAAQGFYVGGHLGQATYRDSCDEVSSCDDSDTGWRILGGFQLGRHLAVEAAYTDLGEISGRDMVLGRRATFTAGVTAAEVVAVGMLPLGQRFGLYGKAGMYRAEVDVHARVRGLLSDTDSESNTGLTFGAGASFSVTQSLELRGEWQRYREVGGEETGEDDIDLLSVGLLFRF